MLEHLDFLQGIEIGFWIKFILVGFGLVILPVWIMNFVPLGIGMKLMFTLAGGVGLWFGLQGKTMRNRR